MISTYKRMISIALSLLAGTGTIMAQQTMEICVSNPSKTPRNDAPIVINLAPYGSVQSALVTCEEKEIPCQLDDLDQDDTFDELCFLADLDSKQTKKYTVTLYPTGEPRSYLPRVFTEMALRNSKVKDKNKQDNFISSVTVTKDCADSYHMQHHHGVDFESEYNGIRIYFDKRQTPDLYGKNKKRLELKETQFYTTKEQKEQGYGDDVLWVGNTFGLGAFRGWDGKAPALLDDVLFRTQRIISYGPLRTIVEIEDKGWRAAADKPRVRAIIRYTQYAGHRDTQVDVIFKQNVNDYLFSTGIINVKGSEEFSDKKGLRACWGTAWPSNDTINQKKETVGLGICVPTPNIKQEIPATIDNYAFLIHIPNQQMRYYITYTSDNEEFGYHNAKDWFKYLKEWKKELEIPIIISIQQKE